MEKREPSLVPEWLRSSGHGSGVGSSNSLSDSLRNSKNRNARSRSDADSVGSPFLDRSSSTNTRRGSSNGSTKHAYSSFNFNRSNRDKDRSREKDRMSYMDPWDNDSSMPFGTFLIGRGEEPLRRSHSMTTRKQGNHLAQGFTVGYKNGGNINTFNGHGILPGTSPVKSSKRMGFNKDFPLLRGEERNGGPDVVRISSPGRSPTAQSLSVANPALIIGEGWTSALAEVPNVIEKSGGAESHANVGNSATLSGPACRNMAEALVQAPGRTGTPPQAQTLEDRAIRQSRQLIPVVPSAPKGSVHNSSDKSKTKPMFRSGETGLASSRNTQQQSSVMLGNMQSNPGSQIKPDTTKKLVILKPARENGVVAGGSPPNSRVAASQPTTAPSTQFTASVRSTNGPRDLRGASVNMLAGKAAEKKLSLAQTQSRHAFYSALKQKTCTNISTDPSKTSSCILSSVEEQANSSKELVASDPSSPQAAERDEIMESVEKVSNVAERISRFESAVRPDPKEAAFLKSLGWDENDSDEYTHTMEEMREWVKDTTTLFLGFF
ncbi:mediator of RNA polymerase II transcription subunit-like protein [Arabidopsis thaliana]|jgi:hypothetical protein|uniref:Mediator of RNA polymerase II transcription subunit-like protein n=1 Tax=Arabidopsis thaliana TaxID=3702 RepID=A0A1P8B7M4_ARATH|nr:mediator of RNA polymerase II transcription subunit-like protein [Arabidopsis thaliana]ANM67596.1 mediator of RNA polymerase II transcription subunit-like protein [Arabidopsis thaliana]|eukprot:NP_001329415.1 mediator of RNA polymerase II transcription subunit-like protein [Arabidopsis thaliana]